MDNIPEMGDEADAPIIVPPPGQILRRAARTKIRKPGLPGDGGGHRFGSTRRGQSVRAATMEPRTSSDISSSGDSAESVTTTQRRRTFSDEGPTHRPDSLSEEAIFDAYVRDDDETPPSLITSSPHPPTVELPVPLQPQLEIQPALLEALGPVIQQPQPQRLLSPQASAEFQALPSRTPSPTEVVQPSPSPESSQSPLPYLFFPQRPVHQHITEKTKIRKVFSANGAAIREVRRMERKRSARPRKKRTQDSSGRCLAAVRRRNRTRIIRHQFMVVSLVGKPPKPSSVLPNPRHTFLPCLQCPRLVETRMQGIPSTWRGRSID
jgi:hypothetical protein